ncbi:MAG: CHAD domain-containing protein, partial [Holophagales bacterium]|nr:CHAD domain-containing protein [Holophagales bacterium]
FADPEVVHTMQGRLEMRRLLPLVRLDLEGHLLRLLDGEKKTVARVRFERPWVRPLSGSAGTPSGEGPEPLELPRRLRLEPVRGYRAQETEVLRLFADRFSLTPAERGLFTEAMDAAGLAPGGYSSKVSISLHPRQPTSAALRTALRSLFDTMLINREGTRLDLDSEFLHDFRVALRRSRSAMSQVKRVFPADLEAHFRKEMKWLGGATGPTRDLDVFLLTIPAYRASLPAAIRRDLEPLNAFLEAHQEEAQAELARVLETPRYRSFEHDWGKLLAEEAPESDPDTPSAEAPNARRPIGKVASERIWRMYRRVIRDGSRIGSESPDEDLHDLRIECKKLRYLLELFRSLYTSGEVDRSIKELKRLQENLGDFNDYCVQEDKLRSFAEQMMAEGDAPAATLLAMGRLQRLLEEHQGSARARFAEIFSRFASDENRRRFRRLFKT